MRRFFVAATAFAAALCGAAAAHDFWMDSDRWAVADGRKIKIDFRVGHASDAKAWRLDPAREVSLTSIGPEGERDQRDALVYPTAGEDSGAAMVLIGDGLHVIAFQTDETYSKLEARKFNAYLEEEGLDLVLKARRRAGRDREPGRELYSRRAKALIRVGAAGADPAPAAIGQTLEIVPLDNPFALADGDALRVRIDYHGAPLPGATVSLENLDVGLWPELRRRTDAAGVAEFSFPRRGAWKLNVVWTRAIADEEPDGARADFETVFSSLTFGY